MADELCQHCAHKLRPAKCPELDNPDWLREKYYVEGATLQAVADLLGVGINDVFRAMQRNGIERRKRGRPPIGKGAVQFSDYGRRLKDEQERRRDLLQAEYVDKGRSLAEIAKEMGVSRERVRQLIKKAGIQSRGLPKRSLTDEEIERLRSLAASGCTARYIHRSLRISLAVLTREAKQLGIEIRFKRKYDDVLTRDFLHEHYVVNGLSTKKIGAMTGIEFNVVNQYLRRNGISLRPRGYKAAHNGLTPS